MSDQGAGTAGMPRMAARLFIRREYAAIRGRRSAVFWALYAIMLCSLLAIVIGKAALAYLREKMEDPFTSMVTIPVLNAQNEGRYGLIKSYLDSCAATHAFDVANSSGNYTTGWFFYSLSQRQDHYTYVYSFGFHQDRGLLEKIVGPGNLVADLSEGQLGDPLAYRDGLIVSLPLLDELGLDTAALRGRALLVREGPFTFPLRVLAVVRALPERSKAYCEHALLRSIDRKDEEGTIPTEDVDQVSVLLSASPDDIGTQKAQWEEGLRKAVPEAALIRFEPSQGMATHGVVAAIDLSTRITMDRGPLYYQQQLNDGAGLPQRLAPRLLWRARFKDPAPANGGADHADESDRYTNLTVTFASLDGIGAFQRDIFRSTQVELDLDRIESKKNFAVVSGLGVALIAALMLFAVLAIVLFLYNTLKNHLERIQMNLGTFLAFGIPERFLMTGYLRIILTLVLRVAGLSMVTLLLGQASVLAFQKMGLHIPEVLAHVDVLGNAWLYLALALMCCACFLIVRYQLRKFLMRPPGDLIYARS